MSQYAILTDLDRCIGCLGCSVACKVANEIQPGNFWLELHRVGPFPASGGSGNWPDVGMYFIAMQCQHCANPECVAVCPTGASQKLDDGTVVIDQDACIGCEACVPACPYGVRKLNEDTATVQKCNLCHDKVEEGELPQCVMQCGGRARYFGKVEDGIESFRGPGRTSILEDPSYDAVDKESFITFGDTAKPYTEEEVHQLPDSGNGPSFYYVVRHAEWKDDDDIFQMHNDSYVASRE